MKALAGVLLFFITIYGVRAQRSCETIKYLKQSGKGQQPSNDEAKNTTNFKDNLHIANRDIIANEIINIPVVIHVLYNSSVENISNEQVRSQLEALNKDFRNLNADRINTPTAFKSFAADTKIQFCLAQVDPQGRTTNGINRKFTSVNSFSTDDGMKSSASGGIDSWDNKHYLNIWVCRLAGRSLGYASPPGGPGSKDGVVIAYDVFGTMGNVRAPFNKGRTATHEIGHWMGLEHIWGDAICGDDKVDDTPAQKSYNFGCPVFPKMSTCSPDSNGDMFMNFMDFSDDACMNMFTKGQAEKMRSLFAKGKARNEFLTSIACDSAMVQGGPLPAEIVLPVTSTPAAPLINVYPNPVLSSVTIECNAGADNICIYNMLGIKVLSAKVTGQKSIYNLSGLAAGVYIIKMEHGRHTYTTKIIKQ